MLSTKFVGGGLLCVGGGIALASFFPVVPLLFPILIFVAGGLSTLGFFKKQQKYFLLSFALALVMLGMVRVSWVEPVRTLEADRAVDRSVELRGVVSADPDRRSATVHYVVEAIELDRVLLEREVSVLVSLPRYPEYAVGDEVIVSGRFILPKDFEIDASRPPFPYVRYLAKDGIGYVMRFPQVIGVHQTPQFFVTKTLSRWKHAILEKGNSIFSEPEGGLLAGMILGEKHALPSDILDQMRIAGLVHIIVVSGYNMTVVAEWVARVFRFLPLAVRSGIGLAVIWMYAGMVSGGAPVIRAAIMTSLALFARMTGNTAIALRLLYLSAAAMILHNPRIVLDDASFHLSFLATLGLIVLSPKITAFFSRKKGTKEKEIHVSWWKELFSATISAQMMVVPYILFFSGQLSPYALPANFLALPLVPIAMGLGTLALLFSAILPFAGTTFGFIASIPATWVLMVGGWFAALPGSDAVFPIPLWGALLLYVVGFFLLRRLWKRDGIDILHK
jgi:competence protein ComEC